MGDMGMTRGLGNWLSGPIGNDLLAQAAVDNAKSLFLMQDQAANRISDNAENQRNLGAAVLEMSKQLSQEVDKRLQEIFAAVKKQEDMGVFEKVFGGLLTAAIALGSVAMGQPQLAVITVILFAGQVSGGTDKLEHLIGGDNAGARAAVGGVIAALALCAGGASVAASGAGRLAILGTAVMAGSSALMSTGVAGNVSEAAGLQGKDGALGIQAGFLALGLLGGVCGGVALAKSGEIALRTEAWVPKAIGLSVAGTTVGMAGQAGAGFVSGSASIDQADATEQAAKARALMQWCDEIRNLETTQGGHYAQSMTAIMNEAAREGVEISKGMASANQFASHLVASA